MHAFRYNPVFHQWVLVGPQPIPTAITLNTSALLDGGKSSAPFVAAHLPHQPLVFDPLEVTMGVEEGQVYASEPPVGEYELLLYRGPEDVFTWTAAQWTGWLELVQQRVRQLHTNEHLQHVHVQFNTGLRKQVEGYHRVGDLVAATQELVGMSTLITDEIATKLHERERFFELHHDTLVHLILPAAPLHENEMWFLPHRHHPSVESVGADERAGMGQLLALLMAHLHHEFPQAEWMVRVHSGMATHAPHLCWWLQVYQAVGTEKPALAVHTLPEYFLKKLRQRTELA